MLNEDKNCIYYHNKYLEKKEKELEGCSEGYKMSQLAFSAFNHLSVYFPDAYQHMLKVWEVENA